MQQTHTGLEPRLNTTLIHLDSIILPLRVAHIGGQLATRPSLTPHCSMHVVVRVSSRWEGGVWKKLTIVAGLCCRGKQKSQAVGDLSSLQLLWAVTHRSGMCLAETTEVK